MKEVRAAGCKLVLLFLLSWLICANFLTFSDSKLSPHRLVIVLAGNPNDITHSLGGTEARDKGCLPSFLLYAELSFFHSHFLSSLKGTLC